MPLDMILTTVGVLGVGLALWSVVRTFREGRFGADVLALLAVVGALAVGEPLAAALISIMLASGLALEARATASASRELRLLVDRQPRVARRRTADGVEVIDIGRVTPGDLLVVTAGEVVPVDGRAGGPASLDESAITGEPMPRQVEVGDLISSGTLNAGPPFDLLATSSADNSGYAEIARLAAGASARSAPMVRLADRLALVLMVGGLAAAAAAWAWTGELSRAVAVLVVATPCPLILAVPIALSAGLSNAAKRGAIVKGGAVLERLARATVLFLDKTGTLTLGRPQVVAVVTTAGRTEAEVLAAAASLDQLSTHVIADALVRGAVDRGLELLPATDVTDEPGRGTSGTISGVAVRVGRAGWLGLDEADPLMVQASRAALGCDGSVVIVEIDAIAAGAVVVADRVRADASRTLRRLRSLGIRRTVMVTGDRIGPAEAVARLVDIDEVLAARSPADKLRDIDRARSQSGDVVVMVGDGVNDAPALAAADVGVAMGAGGGTAATQTADVVLCADRIDRLADAIQIAQEARRIARQSATIGVALSLVAMAFAAVGALPATWGALTQEAIDVAVILNALRVLRVRTDQPRLVGDDAALAQRFSGEHEALRSHLDRLLELADAVGHERAASGIDPAREALQLLRDEVEPHEQAEDADLYPVMAHAVGGADPTAPMSRGHVEIGRLIAQLEHVVDSIEGEPTPTDVNEVRRLLYGLHAVLVLHTSQEDESYLSLADPERPGPTNGSLR